MSGLYAGEAIRSLDLPPLMAVVMFGAFFIVLFNTIVDILYAVLDPAHPARRGGAGMSAILTVDDLRVSFATEDGVVKAVDGVSFELAAGEVLAIVGESGCGKSVTAQTMTGLTRAPNARITGSVNYRGREINGLTTISCGTSAASRSRWSSRTRCAR